MDLLQAFRVYINRHQLFSSGDRLLLAVSGGMDSVVLCELCHLAGQDFVIAHCNFRLRGSESDRDEDFVRRVGEKYAKRVYVKTFDTETFAANNKLSIQVAARELRYSWFRELLHSSWSPGPEAMVPLDPAMKSLKSYSLARIVTAHHLDDNLETLLMNFFKGTGIAGMRGMLPMQGKIVRPLLFAGREMIRQFAVRQNLEWVEDSSNESDKYTRNYFRHQVIPLVEQVYPGAQQNLADQLERFRGIEWVYRGAIDQFKKKLLEPRGSQWHIPVVKLKKMAPQPEALQTLVYEIIRDFDFTSHQVAELVRLLDSETGRYIESSSHRILKNRNWLIISPKSSLQDGHFLIEWPEGDFIYGKEALHFQCMPVSPDQPLPIPQTKGRLPRVKTGTDAPGITQIAFLDAATIRFPLILRKWKPGDYFYPLGMRKKKKLARFFIDCKLSGADKEKIWVLEMDKKIIWVVGHRIDDRCKITPNTQMVLKIESRML